MYLQLLSRVTLLSKQTSINESITDVSTSLIICTVSRDGKSRVLPVWWTRTSLDKCPWNISSVRLHLNERNKAISQVIQQYFLVERDTKTVITADSTLYMCPFNDQRKPDASVVKQLTHCDNVDMQNNQDTRRLKYNYSYLHSFDYNKQIQ